jgi:hypothetical protein
MPTLSGKLGDVGADEAGGSGNANAHKKDTLVIAKTAYFAAGGGGAGTDGGIGAGV